jgi:hypothetical protein
MEKKVAKTVAKTMAQTVAKPECQNVCTKAQLKVQTIYIKSLLKPENTYNTACFKTVYLDKI